MGTFEVAPTIILSLISLLFAIVLRTLFKSRKAPSLLPSPPGLPIIGHMHLLTRTPHKAFQELSIKYGPFFRIVLGSLPCIVVSSPEIAKQMLKNDEISFANRAKIDSIDCLTYGSDFAFAPYGPYWKFMKKLCMTELLGSKTVDTLHFIRRDEIKNFIGVLSMKSKNREKVDVRGELIRLVNNVITRMVMSKRCSRNEDEAKKVRKLITEMVEVAGKFNLADFYSFFRRFDLQGIRKNIKKVRGRFDEMMDRIIDEHKERRRNQEKDGDDMKDLLDILLDISENENSEMSLTKENIKAFIMDIFSGGTDTSTITVEWALAELINHPDIMKKAREQIDSVIGNEKRLIDECDIEKLPLLQAIVKETLRLHPPAPFVLRESTEECTVNGYRVGPKTRVFVNVWAMGRDTKYWENPLDFVPERFLRKDGSGNSDFDVKGQSFQFLPFGSGRRGCPGINLAMKIIQTTLAATVQCFDWEVCEGQNGKCLDMEEGLGINLSMAKPLVCVPIARLEAFPSI